MRSLLVLCSSKSSFKYVLLIPVILQDGTIDEMEQGNYSILREHPAMRTYNSTIQRYSAIIKQLSDLLPKEVDKPEDDGFDSFVMKK